MRHLFLSRAVFHIAAILAFALPMAAGAADCDPVPSGIVSWWKGEGDALDSAGDNDGVLQNGISFAPGEVGEAFSYTVNDADVVIPASPSLNVGLQPGFTIEAWVNPTDVTQYGPIFEWNDDGANWGVHLYVGPISSTPGPGSIYANVMDNTQTSHDFSSTSANVMADGVFAHIALTYDKASGVAVIYCNGVNVGQQTVGTFTPETSFNLYLGRRPLTHGEDYSFQGLIDEAAVYDRALSQSEIQAIYNAGSAGKCATPTLPVIVLQPTNQTAVASQTVTLTAAAGGTPPLVYQWQFNGTNLPAATNSALTLTNVGLSQGGWYDVVVTNPVGSITSTSAMLSVQFVLVEVNGQPDTNTVSAVAPATVTILGGYPGGTHFYTLDGSVPTTNSTLYTQPITLTNSATVSVFSVTGDFTQSSNSPPVAVQVVSAYHLQTSIVGNGTLSASPAGGPYVSNSVVTLTATAGAYWAFDHWAGDASGNENPLSLTMNEPHNVEAVFVQTAFPLTASTPGGGTVTVNGQSIAAQSYYPLGTNLTILAVPNAGWTFVGWQGSVGGTNNPLTLTVSQTNNVQAIFGTMVGTNATGGSIVLSATNPVPYGTSLTVSAIPNPGNYFVSWTGGGSGNSDEYRLTTVASPNPAFGAEFAPLPAGKCSLNVVATGSGYATVSPQFSYYNSGTTVTVTESPNNGNYFFGWSGNATGSASPLTVVMTTNMVIQANFGLGSLVSVAPLAQTVLAGSNGILTASALGRQPLAYQWFNGQGLIAQATNPAYTLSNAQPANAGGYRVVVSNSVGSVTSAVATVTVIGTPWITNQPAPVTVTMGHAATFAVGAGGWPALAYQWQLNGASVAGATNAALVLSNAWPADAGVYSVTVTNVYGSLTSNPAQLTVLPLELLLPSGLVDGHLQFSFDTAAGAAYEVQYSTNLTDWQPWLDLYGTGQPFTLRDPNTGGNPRQFYRVVLTPP